MKTSLHAGLGYLAGVCAVIMILSLLPNVSLPYRIGPAHYQTWLIAQKLMIVAVITGSAAIILGIIAFIIAPFDRERRRWWASGITLGPLVILIVLVSFVSIPEFVHSGPNPQSWCYNNLRQIDSAKEQLSMIKHLTNGTVVISSDVNSFFKNGFDCLNCAMSGRYTINPIGTEPRCSFHGSMSQMEAEWKRNMEVQSTAGN